MGKVDFSVSQGFLDALPDLPKIRFGHMIAALVYQALRDNEWSRSRAARQTDLSMQAIRDHIKRMRIDGVMIPNDPRSGQN